MTELRTHEDLERERMARVLDVALAIMTFLVDQKERVQPRPLAPLYVPQAHDHQPRRKRAA